ncbi:MAG TPA: HlyD family efflux transporter periplasmic adaptor subunit [Syntrophomonadaceae bacterium]|nr:HlyD family efflux transporter periplasmic adaptor subunit [Syntrophomonadaceae bacterium]
MALTKLKQLLSKRKWQVGLAVVLLLAAAGTWHYLAKRGSNGGYETARVEYGEIVQTISASGNVEPVQAVTLTFKSQGYVESCSVHVGDRVKAGQVLAVQRQTDLQHEYEQAQASLASAQANYDKLVATKPHEIAQLNAQLEVDKIALDNAKATLDRSQALFEAGVISQSEVESARESYQSALAKYQSDLSNLAITSNDADIKIALANLKSARSNLEQARENLNSTRIIAPFDGYVAEINGNVGQWTGGGAASSSNGSSSDSSQFYIYLSSTELQLSAKINEADISKVKTGQKVTFTVDTYPDKTFTGKIAYLAPMATTVNNVQMFDAKISIDDYSLLKGGLPASIKIIVNSASHVLTVPQEALSFARTYLAETAMKNSGGSRRLSTQAGSRGTSQSAPAFAKSDSTSGSSFVVVLQNGQPRLQRVQTGISDDMNVEIKTGLQQGDTIIVRQLTATGSGSSSTSRSSSGQRSSSGMPGIPEMGPGPAGPAGGR